MAAKYYIVLFDSHAGLKEVARVPLKNVREKTYKTRPYTRMFADDITISSNGWIADRVMLYIEPLKKFCGFLSWASPTASENTPHDYILKFNKRLGVAVLS